MPPPPTFMLKNNTGDQKIKMWKSYQMSSYEMQNVEWIPNLASKFKLDNIWPSFWPKNCQKYAKSGILPISMLFGTKGGQMLFNLNYQIKWGPMRCRMIRGFQIQIQ